MIATSGRASALRRGIRLEILTVVWMAVEGAAAIGAGIAARSILLTAFGFDSLIELLSGGLLLWRLSVEHRGGDGRRVDAVERSATRISGVLLALLCAYVLVTSVLGLLLQVEAEGSGLGIGVSALAVVFMPWLALRKRSVNATLQSPALRADIAESATCAYLAAVTLVGVGIATLTGWWWIQYAAALLLLRWLIPEAREAFEAAREMDGRT